MRKTKELMITAEGRDKGKLFVITEMPARQAERWASRLFLAMTRSGVDVPANFLASGIVAVAVMGIGALSQMSFADAEVLLDEMMTCVQIRPNQDDINYQRKLVDAGTAGDDIEEVETRLTLRMEVITLHTGFTLADVRSALNQMQASAQNSQTTQTSPGSLAA